MPVIDCLLGDKLTAFAPNTIGIHYASKSSMQIIKQLFDVSELFTAAEDIALVRKSYNALADAEIGYRGGKYTEEQAIIRGSNAVLRHGEISLPVQQIKIR